MLTASTELYQALDGALDDVNPSLEDALGALAYLLAEVAYYAYDEEDTLPENLIALLQSCYDHVVRHSEEVTIN